MGFSNTKVHRWPALLSRTRLRRLPGQKTARFKTGLPIIVVALGGTSLCFEYARGGGRPVWRSGFEMEQDRDRKTRRGD